MADPSEGNTTRGPEDTLFPQPDSPAGRLLGHLVALQVPGTPMEIALSGLAGAVRLAPDVAAGALSRLAGDGLISLDPEPESEHMSVTVMLSPPLDEYGIQPQWGETTDERHPPDDGQAPGESGARGAGRGPETMSARPGATPGSEATPDDLSAPATPPRPPPGRPRRGAPARASADPGATSPGATSPTPGATISVRPPRSTAGAGAPVEASGRRASQRVRGDEPAEGPAAGGPAESRPAESRLSTGRTASPAVAGSSDETTLVRGFVERFEKLLAECEEWRRRAQVAEERATTTERLLRAAERRASSAEAKLATAQERLRAWSDLTQRMQQLTRQADTAGRNRAPRSRTASAEPAGTASGEGG